MSSQKVKWKEEKKIPFNVQRSVYDMDELDEKAEYQLPTVTLKEWILNYYRSIQFSIFDLIPILKWLPRYQKKNLANDIIAGFTVAVIQIPQGIAYASLANVEPLVGIYTGLFPVFVYGFLGTSRHVSLGTFAIVALMHGDIVTKHVPEEYILRHGNVAATVVYTPVQVVTAVAITVAIYQMIMYLFGLGIITRLLSDTTVNAFTCGASFHITASQFKEFFGVTIHSRGSLFRIVHTVKDVIEMLPVANKTTVVISTVSLIILVIYNEILKPRIARKTPIPVPIELVVIIIAIITSRHMHWKSDYKVRVVDNIPTGLPSLELPPLALIPLVAADAFVVNLISFSITVSLGFVMAERVGYKIDANQELFALSVSNAFGSFVSCMSVSASMSRTTIQQGIGGVTQLTSLFCCLALLIFVLFMGPFLNELPKCLLSCIVMVHLKSTMFQFTNVKKYWLLCKWDFIIWTSTFCCTVFISVTSGLVVGVCISMLSNFIRGEQPHTCVLGVLPNTELYLDVNCYKGVKQIDGLKIFSYNGNLSFISKDTFLSTVTRVTEINPIEILEERQNAKKPLPTTNDDLGLKCIIVDFSSLMYADLTGVAALTLVGQQYGQLDISLYITGCSVPVTDAIRRCAQNSNFLIFPTVHDAVLFAQVNSLKKTV